MKNFIITLLLAIAIGTVITLNSCKKETTAATVDDSVSAQDNTTISNAINATTNDAASAAGGAQSYSGKTDGWWGLVVFCGVTIVDTGSISHRTITITYDGTTNCNGIIRAGSITISDTSGIPWRDAGSSIVIAFNGLNVTDVVSGSSYTIKGSHTLTKETPGLAWQVIAELATNTTVTYRSKGSMNITFSNGVERMWKFDRTISWNSAISGYRNTITASIYAEGPGNVDASGINRFGQVFDNSIVTTISANNNTRCFWKPYQGQTLHLINNTSTTVVYGTNRQGTQIGTPTICGDGYYITYSVGNRTVNRFVSYW